MDKLITNLDTNLGPVLREQLDSNFQKIQNGVDGQADSLNKQIETMLGDVPLQDKNEVTQARIDNNGVPYQTLKGRLDVNQSTAETALKEERLTSAEVQSARSNTSGKTYPSLGDRINDEEASLINGMNAKISQISSVPETFASLSVLQSTYPNGKTGVFVTADNGHKFIWANGGWSDAGIYQSVGVADQSINPSALSDTYDLKGDGVVHRGFYVSAYDTNNKIVLDNTYMSGFDTLEVTRNKTGIIHINKPSNMTTGQLLMITDLQDFILSPNYWPYNIISYVNQAIDYFVFVTETEVLVNLDRITEAFGDKYKVWVSLPSTGSKITLTNTKNNSFRSYLK